MSYLHKVKLKHRLKHVSSRPAIFKLYNYNFPIPLQQKSHHFALPNSLVNPLERKKIIPLKRGDRLKSGLVKSTYFTKLDFLNVHKILLIYRNNTIQTCKGKHLPVSMS